MSDDIHEIYAIKYGHHERKKAENYIGGDPHDVNDPLDFFVWAIVGPSGTIRGRHRLRRRDGEEAQSHALKPIAEGLKSIDIAPDKVANVIVSHLHYDHPATTTAFRTRAIHLQDTEMAYATGRCMCHQPLRLPFEEEDVVAMVRKVFAGRVTFHDGVSQVAPGIMVHKIGGHSKGLQCVSVKTKRGMVVLASDATHLYAHIEDGRVFPITYNVGEVLDGYDTIKKLAPSAKHVVPGHDPLVLERYPAARPGLEGGSRGSTSIQNPEAPGASEKPFCARCDCAVECRQSRQSPRANKRTFRGRTPMTIFIRGHSRRRVLGYGAAGVAALGMPSIARAQAQVVRIGLPTKTYYPTIIAETALRQKLFDKEGIKAELTIYRGGAEGYEAMAAGAADVILNSASSVAAGMKKGVMAKNVAGAALGYYGWHLVVKPDSPIKDVKELDGKKIGITSAGSGTDILARWTQQDRKVTFTRVPLGGGGLVPNLLSGNIDASVMYSPLSYKLFIEKTARSLIDYGAAVPPNMTGAWMATDKFIKEKPQVAAEDAERALWRARLPAGPEEPRRRDQADRRDRRDPGQHRGGRARRQHRQAVEGRRDAEGLDEPRARHGAHDRHDRPRAGGGYLHDAVQAGADDGVTTVLSSRGAREAARRVA